jgi:hypothetical protein
MVPQAIGTDAVNRRFDLDGALPNQLIIAAGLGKPTRNELLAKYYLRVAGVAAMWIDVGAQDVASIENEPGRIVYCCERGVVQVQLPPHIEKPTSSARGEGASYNDNAEFAFVASALRR